MKNRKCFVTVHWLAVGSNCVCAHVREPSANQVANVFERTRVKYRHCFVLCVFSKIHQ